MPRFFSQVHDPATLQAMASPASVKGTENLTEVLYDTKQLGAADTRLTFFTAADVDNGFFTNMEQAGMLPKDQWFGAYYLVVNVLGYAPVAAAGDPFAEVWEVLHGDTPANGFPYIKWKVGTNIYPQSGGIPLWECYSEMPAFVATTQATSLDYAGVKGMGWDLGTLPSGDPVVVIPGQRQFSFEIDWPNAPAGLTTQPYIRVGLVGTLYRGVGA